MNLAKAIMHLYPNASPITDFNVVGDADGSNQSIIFWDVKDANGNPIAEPTVEELQSHWLDALKDDKITNLNDSCNQTILAGFTSSASGTSHTYPFDYEAQLNFNGWLNMLGVDSTITQVEFKTNDAGVIVHTKDQFIALCKDGMLHKKSNIEKYWNLKNTVLTATTEETINQIVWS